MENTNINWSTQSDQAIVESIGAYLKQKRLEINKTQAQLALESGLNRWTVTQIEKGEAISLVSLIQIMRALDVLHLLDIFSTKEKISPLLLAKLAKKKKQRARSPINKPLQSDSSW
ncbi:helix-turn-helix transcriptional regulator [Aquirufa ecclesiirivi]|uniref:Helix-turn-helix transcriptional regulator n=1 Tax=Aquirufa ecclesiirivi TaxID=2715124 RepID=A0ABT4JJC2_9BACT|nr:helix-turn-helix transcriptional regulator [Aquirufa ecclesiirivi]MCZ2476374.1 helix-turn-helix transcriptional regulator [Aquirufa ecclesiirivi]